MTRFREALIFNPVEVVEHENPNNNHLPYYIRFECNKVVQLTKKPSY